PKIHILKSQSLEVISALIKETPESALASYIIYRNSYKKNVCVDMLRDGYHKSFTELFALAEKWDALREAARVRSLSWAQRPLEEQPDKLDHFYYYLTRAETAERKEYFEEVYNNLYALACYFNNSEDKWVRNHFYERCFKIAQVIKIDGGKKEAEAHGHMGLLFEEDERRGGKAFVPQEIAHCILQHGRYWNVADGQGLSWVIGMKSRTIQRERGCRECKGKAQHCLELSEEANLDLNTHESTISDFLKSVNMFVLEDLLISRAWLQHPRGTKEQMKMSRNHVVGTGHLGAGWLSILQFRCLLGWQAWSTHGLTNTCSRSVAVPWGRKESDTAEGLTHTHTHHCHKESDTTE
ncbi:hypothetical protein FD754_004109, partial [Muntiacus muntjak]